VIIVDRIESRLAVKRDNLKLSEGVVADLQQKLVDAKARTAQLQTEVRDLEDKLVTAMRDEQVLLDAEGSVMDAVELERVSRELDVLSHELGLDLESEDG